MKLINAAGPAAQAGRSVVAIAAQPAAEVGKGGGVPSHPMIDIQRKVGNGAVNKLIKSNASSAAAKAPTEDQILTEAERQNEAFGGISVAFYVTGKKWGHLTHRVQRMVHNKKTNKDELKEVEEEIKPVVWGVKGVEGASEFLHQAQQFSADHLAIGVQGVVLKSGKDGAMELSRTLPQLLAALYAAFDAAHAARKEPAAKRKPIRIRTLAIFTHGWEQNLKANVHQDEKTETPLAAELTGKEMDESGKPTGRSTYTAFVASIGDHLSPYGKVILYACRTAGLTNEDNKKQKIAVPLAAGLASGVQDRIKLGRHLDDTQVGVEVWGHLDSGHTTANSRLAMLHGLGSSTDYRTELAPFMARMAVQLVLARTLAFKNPEQFEALSSTLEPKLYLEALDGMRAAFNLTGNQTAADNANNVFNREIPSLGLHRIFRDMSAGWLGADAASRVTDTATLALSPEVKVRLKAGMDALRPRFVGVLDALRASIRDRAPAGSIR